MGTPTWPSFYPADDGEAWRNPRVVGPGQIGGPQGSLPTGPPTGAEQLQPQQMPSKRPPAQMQAPSQFHITGPSDLSVVEAAVAASAAALHHNSQLLGAPGGAVAVTMAASAALQNLQQAVQGNATTGPGAPGAARRAWRWHQVTPPPAPNVPLQQQEGTPPPPPPPAASAAAGTGVAGGGAELPTWSQDAPAPCPQPQQQGFQTPPPPPQPQPAAQPLALVPVPPSLTPGSPLLVPASAPQATMQAPPPLSPAAPGSPAIGSKPAWQAGRPVPLRLPAQAVAPRAAGPVCVQQAAAVRAQVLSPRQQPVTHGGAPAPAAAPAVAAAGVAGAGAALGQAPVLLSQEDLEELLIVLDTNVWMLPEGRRMLRQMGPCQGWLPPADTQQPGPGAGAAGDAAMGEADPSAAAAAGSSATSSAAQPAHTTAAAGPGAATGAGAGAPAAAAAGAQPAAPPARRKRVVVVVPLRVVSELDNLKSNSNKEKAQNAQDANRLLRELSEMGEGDRCLLRFETQEEYLAAQSKLLQLPQHNCDDEIVQCAAHLQALMAAASAADGVRRLVLLCSGDNNVVGGKVHLVGVRPVFFPALEPHLAPLEGGPAVVALLLGVGAAAATGALAQLLRRPVRVVRSVRPAGRAPLGVPAPMLSKQMEQLLLAGQNDLGKPGGTPPGKRAKVQGGVHRPAGTMAAAAAGGPAKGGPVTRAAAAAVAAALAQAAGKKRGREVAGAPRAGTRSPSPLPGGVRSEKHALAYNTLERLGRAVRLTLEGMVAGAQGLGEAGGNKQQKKKAKGAAAAPAAPPASYNGGSLNTRQAAIKLLEALSMYCPEPRAAPKQLVLFFRDQVELLVAKDSQAECVDTLHALVPVALALQEREADTLQLSQVKQAAQGLALVETSLAATRTAWADNAEGRLQLLLSNQGPNRPRLQLLLGVSKVAGALGPRLQLLLKRAGPPVPLPSRSPGMSPATWAGLVASSAVAQRTVANATGAAWLRRVCEAHAAYLGVGAAPEQVARFCRSYADLLALKDQAAVEALQGVSAQQVAVLGSTQVADLQASLAPHLTTLVTQLSAALPASGSTVQGGQKKPAGAVAGAAGVVAGAGQQQAAAAGPWAAPAVVGQPPPAQAHAPAILAAAAAAAAGRAAATQAAEAAARSACAIAHLPQPAARPVAPPGVGVMQQVAVDMDTSVSQAAPGPPAAAQPAVLGATGRAPAVAAAAAAVTNDLGGIAEWNLFALAGLPLPQAGGAAGDTDMYMEPAAAQQGRGRLVAQQGPPGAGRGREDDSDMELSYGDAPPQPAVKHPAAAPLPPWRGAEPAAMEQGAAAAGAIGAIGAGGPAAAAGGAVGQAPVGAAGAAAAVAAAGGEQAAPRPARRPKASEVLQALLGATAASPAPQDVTPVFDALAAALGVTLDALTTQQRDGVVLDPAELLRAANAVPAPGRSRPLEVVDFCRAHAGVLMKQAHAKSAAKALRNIREAVLARDEGVRLRLGPGPGRLLWSRDTASGALRWLRSLEGALRHPPAAPPTPA